PEAPAQPAAEAPYDPAQGLRETYQNEFEAGPYPAQYLAGDRLRAEQPYAPEAYSAEAYPAEPQAPQPMPPLQPRGHAPGSYGLEEFEAAARDAAAAQERAAASAEAARAGSF